MQKLRNEVIEKLNHVNITNAELDVVLFLSRYQDEAGQVVGVYYKDVCQALDISYQTFYNVLISLQDKGILAVEKNTYIDYDIKILDNDFSDGNYKDYLNMNYAIYRDKKFMSLKVNEKLIVLKLLRIFFTKHDTKQPTSYANNMDEFYKEIQKDLHMKIGMRTLKEYLKQLKSIFSIDIKNGNLFVKTISNIFEKIKNSEEFQLNENRIVVICRRTSTIAEEKDVQELAQLINRKSQELSKETDESNVFIKLLTIAIKASQSKKDKSLRADGAYCVLDTLIKKETSNQGIVMQS